MSGRAIRAECRQHLRDRKGRTRAAAARAPKPGQRGSRRWRKHRSSERQAAGPARAAGSARPSTRPPKQVITWAVDHRIGTLAVGDPRGVLHLKAGRRHNQRTRDWRVGHLIRALTDKAEAAAITVHLVDERGTSSTCPNCTRRVPKPAGRNFTLPALRAGRAPRPGRGRQHRRQGTWRRHHPRRPARARGSRTVAPGAHLPGVHPARRDPRRRPPSRPAPRRHLAGTGPPHTPPGNGGNTGSRSPARRHLRPIPVPATLAA